MEYKIVNTGVKKLMFVALLETYDHVAFREEARGVFEKYRVAQLFLLGEEKESDLIPLFKANDAAPGTYLLPNSAVNMGGGIVRTMYLPAVDCWKSFLDGHEIRIAELPPMPPEEDTKEMSPVMLNGYKMFRAGYKIRIDRYHELKHLNEKHWIVLEVSEAAGPAAPDNSPQNSNL